MALPPSGPITMGMINTELGYPATQIISLNDAAVRALAQVPAGMISLSNFYGKSSVINIGLLLSSPVASLINKLDFSNETLTTFSPTGIANAYAYSSSMNSNTTGYTAGGGQPSPGTTQPTLGQRVSSISFSTLTGANLANIGSLVTGVGGEYSSADAGFISTGRSTTAFPVTVRKMPFSSGAFSTIGATSPINRYETGSAQNAFICGYTYNGRVGPSPSFPTSAEKFTFSNESMAVAPSNMPTARVTGNAFQSDTLGYWLGGSPQIPHIGRNTSTTAITFANETCSNLGITTAVGRGMSVLNGKNVGYSIGSEPTPTTYEPPSFYGQFSKITFATNTFANMPLYVQPAVPFQANGIRATGTQPSGVRP